MFLLWIVLLLFGYYSVDRVSTLGRMVFLDIAANVNTTASVAGRSPEFMEQIPQSGNGVPV